jgi:hypothetical protein
MIRSLTAVGLALSLCGCDTQNAKTAEAMVTSLEEALKGQPLTVLYVEDIIKASSTEELYVGWVGVRRVGEQRGTIFRTFLMRLCDEPEPKCWKVMEVVNFREGVHVTIFRSKDLEKSYVP